MNSIDAASKHHTQGKNALFASMDGPMIAKANKRTKNRNTVNLASSAYVRDAGAFSVISNDVASGTSMLGNSQREKSKIQSLA